MKHQKSKLDLRGTILGGGTPKIAVSVSERTCEETLIRAKQVREAGADLIELRADCALASGGECNAADLVLSAAGGAGGLPVIFTIRTAGEGGMFGGSEEEYAEAVRCAIRSGAVDLVDIEMERNCSGDLLRFAHEAGVPAVLSYHDFEKTPPKEELLRRYVNMESMGADVAKIACMPRDRFDTTALLAASAVAKENMSIPFISISMGEKGNLSRICGEVFGSCLTFAALGGVVSAPGQIETEELSGLLGVVRRRREEEPFLFLTGFMGSGKSSVGRAISRMTGLPSVDMDTAIEEAEGMPIPDIFEKYGENYFRDLESEYLIHLADQPGAIVACGGGAVLRPENAAVMRQLGRVIFLEASPEELLDRLTGESEGRPNIRNRMTVQGIRELLGRRMPYYEAAADEVVSTDGISPDEIAARILSACGSVI